MEKSKGTVALIGLAFVAGGIVVWILTTVLGAKPSKVNVGPIEFAIPTATTAPQPASTVEQTVQQSQSTNSTPNFSTPGTLSRGLFICGEPAFNENLTTRDPLFLRPDGYLSGWISSDPSTVVLPDGTTKIFETQYVLIVEDLPSVQIKGVQRQAGKANTWGCWYSADLSAFIAEDAKTDFCKKKAGGNVAVMYRVSSSGFEELATTATISCP